MKDWWCIMSSYTFSYLNSKSLPGSLKEEKLARSLCQPSVVQLFHNEKVQESTNSAEFTLTVAIKARLSIYRCFHACLKMYSQHLQKV